MKLRNKETGGLATLEVYEECYTVRTDAGWQDYDSLKELNEEWEDYEEPKDYWFIDSCGGINKQEDDILGANRRIIGNYFETKEEAEKAVEKLKAWKRLRDKGFKFCKYSALAYGEIDFRIPDFESWDDSDNEQVKHDLDLLFGGEE